MDCLNCPCLSRRTYRLSVPVSISSRLEIMLSSVENQKRTGFQNVARCFELNGTWRIKKSLVPPAKSVSQATEEAQANQPDFRHRAGLDKCLPKSGTDCAWRTSPRKGRSADRGKWKMLGIKQD